MDKNNILFKRWVALLADLVRRASTELPADIVNGLRKGNSLEKMSSGAQNTLCTLLDNIDIARQKSVPMCQDTGTLSFWYELPAGADTVFFTEVTHAAVMEATSRGWLRLNVIDVPSGKQITDNVSDGNPSIYFTTSNKIRVRLLLKGGGCENVSTQYSLPDTGLDAGRDLEGVRKCLLDAVWQAQGNGCAPGILGVCIGGDRAAGYIKAKEQLLRTLEDSAPLPELAQLEKRVLEDANSLGIGPMGLGGNTTLLGVKVGTLPRLPASYFVTIAYSCWACRRAELFATPEGEEIAYG
ncbi:MAG: fumarate hydratase [Lentisphaerae bacterium]|nr:fumarate hydratase [Lentisphaerota bacterium]